MKTKKDTAHEQASGTAIASITTRFCDEIREVLRQARQKAYAATNHIMVETYWDIGRRIVEEEQQGKARAQYGSHLIQTLARQLGNEFGEGVSVANLKNFRQFYLTFPNAEKSYALRSLLTWTHWRLIMRVENPAARDYYIQEAVQQSWNTRTLARNIASMTFERLLVPPPVQVSSLSTPRALDARTFLKDPYVLEFLGLPEPHTRNEAALESAIIVPLQQFLMELGRGFSFVARQLRISTETSHFYVDLVFYNYLLKCFVLIDLKTRKLTHQDIGQIDMYVRMFDALKRGPDDNPTLGVIFCTDKDETMVRYSVLSESEQLFASKYRLILPSEEELRDELERRHILDLPETG